jgi:DNA polymerase-3 subunit epsilon
MLPIQRSFSELGTALVDTTFVVVDLETTGGSPIDSQITEIGAVKVRGGDVLGEFSTLVDPGSGIPPFITVLTGITDAMVVGAPKIEEALPTFLEFVGPDAVLVAHNAAFDSRFLSHESARLGYRDWSPPVVCTVRLARRLVRDEVPNLRLATLATALRARTPCHRALADARAATDVLHALLELAGRWGVTHLDDLLWFQSAGGHPQARKRILAEALPRGRGVYMFYGPAGELLYVGKATDLRSRVRSYFSGDDRRKVGQLLRDLCEVGHLSTRLEVESAVLEARLIRRHRPPYNRAGRGVAGRTWIRLTAERFPRVTIARGPSPGAIGPMTSARAAVVREALEESAPIRRCNDRIGARTRFAPCLLEEIGRCPAPCDGRISPDDYVAGIAPVNEALGGDPTAALARLDERMSRLAVDTRYEEAANTRDRASALASMLERRRTAAALAAAGRIVLDAGGTEVVIENGCLTSVSGRPLAVPSDGHTDEARIIERWLRKDRAARLVHCEGDYAMPVAGGRSIASWLRRLEHARRAEARAG